MYIQDVSEIAHFLENRDFRNWNKFTTKNNKNLFSY